MQTYRLVRYSRDREITILQTLVGRGYLGSTYYWQGEFLRQNPKRPLYFLVNANNIVVAALDIIPIKTSTNKGKLRIEMIETVSKEQGIGVFAVKALFEQGKSLFGFDVTSVVGESLYNAIYFWKQIGAKYYISDSRLQEYYDECEMAYFELSKVSFNRYLNSKH